MIATLKLNKNAGARGKRAPPKALPVGDLFDPEPVHLRHSGGLKTEVAALAKVAPRLNSMRQRILADITAAGATGLTPDDWADDHDALINTVRRRFTDLWKGGFIRHHPSERTEKNAAGNDCITWVAGADPKREAARRTPKDYAIEFGEYLAAAAEVFMEEVNRGGSSDDAMRDAWSGLRSAIYEFRKRVPK